MSQYTVCPDCGQDLHIHPKKYTTGKNCSRCQEEARHIYEMEKDFRKASWRAPRAGIISDIMEVFGL